MFKGWLEGAARSTDAWDSNRDSNRSYLEEPPETPAHLFAVRAFKTAIFGTPAPPRQYDDAHEDIKEQGAFVLPNPGAEEGSSKPAGSSLPPVAQRPESWVSPTKGILLTPGTAVSRRKTVSFGGLGTHHVKGSNGPENNDIRRNLFPSRLDSIEGAAAASSSVEHGEVKIAAENIGPEIAENAQCKRSNNIAGGSATSEDVTVDLQSPRSKSGQHWKREYHRNHDKSKTEMGKLIKYSQVTKSYAVKRDADATRLAEKLNRAETRLKEMEKRVSDLASQLVSSRAQEDSQSDIINELTAQTAETLRYKRKAEKYRLALQMQDEQQGRENGDGPRLNGELSVDDLSKIVNLRAEIASLREVAEKAEDRATDLDRENQALKGTLARVKEEMKSYEIRYKAREEARKKRNERTAAKQKELKNQLEASRSENQQLQLQLRSKNQASTSHLLEEIADLKEKLRRQTARSAKSSEISRERRKEPRLASKQYGLEPQVSLLPQVGDWRQRDMGFNARCENQRLEPSSPVDLMNLGRFTRETVKEPVPTVSNQAGKTPQTMDEAVQESSDIWTLPKPRLTKPLNIDQEYERPLSPINQNTSKPQGAARPSRSPLAGSQATARPRVSQRRARREIASAVAGSEQTKGPTYSEGLSKPAEQILQKARERQQRREQKDAGKGKENLSPLNW